jgi:hypothetical protein
VLDCHAQIVDGLSSSLRIDVAECPDSAQLRHNLTLNLVPAAPRISSSPIFRGLSVYLLLASC